MGQGLKWTVKRGVWILKRQVPYHVLPTGQVSHGNLSPSPTLDAQASVCATQGLCSHQNLR